MAKVIDFRAAAAAKGRCAKRNPVAEYERAQAEMRRAIERAAKAFQALQDAKVAHA